MKKVKVQQLLLIMKNKYFINYLFLFKLYIFLNKFRKTKLS